MTVNVFSVPIFFILFRETLEASIIVSVLLSIVKTSIGNEDTLLKKRLIKQIWFGSLLSFGICLGLGVAFIAVWYTLARNLWGLAENLWEGVFCLIAAVLIALMSLAILQIANLEKKWTVKLSQSMANGQVTGIAGKSRKYAMFLLPFITVLREGLEAIVFVGGVGLSEPASSFPLAVLTGLLCGLLVGYFIYRGGSFIKIKYFVIISTCVLYLIAAGLFSRGIWLFEAYRWGKIVGGDSDKLGTGPGSYDVTKSVWHVNCCDPENQSNGGWGIFNHVLGWQNSATVGSVVSYCMFWIFVTAVLILIRIDEHRVSRGKAGIWGTVLRKGFKKKEEMSENVDGGTGAPSGNAPEQSPLKLEIANEFEVSKSE